MSSSSGAVAVIVSPPEVVCGSSIAEPVPARSAEPPATRRAARCGVAQLVEHQLPKLTGRLPASLPCDHPARPGDEASHRHGFLLRPEPTDRLRSGAEGPRCGRRPLASSGLGIADHAGVAQLVRACSFRKLRVVGSSPIARFRRRLGNGPFVRWREARGSARRRHSNAVFATTAPGAAIARSGLLIDTLAVGERGRRSSRSGGLPSRRIHRRRSSSDSARSRISRMPDLSARSGPARTACHRVEQNPAAHGRQHGSCVTASDRLRRPTPNRTATRRRGRAGHLVATVGSRCGELGRQLSRSCGTRAPGTPRPFDHSVGAEGPVGTPCNTGGTLNGQRPPHRHTSGETAAPTRTRA